MAFNDLCALALNRDMLDSIRPQMRAIAAESFSDSVSMGRYSMELSRGLSMLLDHDPGASDVLRQASPLIDSKVDTERYKATHNLYLAAALMAEGRLDEARTRLRESEMTALANSLSDMLPHIYGGFARLETLAGDREAASRATMRMLSVRDSLYNARSFGRIKDMESSATIEGLTNSLTEAETSSNHRNAVILILSFSILLVLSLVWMLIRRNRSLKASYEALARKNSELAEMSRPARITQSSGMIPLSGEEQRQLASDIINLLEKDPRIFSPDFSADELAAILDSKVKYVSAVINSSFGKIFPPSWPITVFARLAGCSRILRRAPRSLWRGWPKG